MPEEISLDKRLFGDKLTTDTETQHKDTVADMPSLLDARMREIPDNQKEFLIDHLVPETLSLIGIILGEDGLRFFQPMTDMNKKISIVDREPTEVDSDEESLAVKQEQETEIVPEQPVQQEPEDDTFTI